MRYILLNILIVIPFLLFSQARPETIIVNPQANKSDISLNIRVGVSIPNGEFADENNGLAEEDLALEVDISKAIGNDFYLNFSVKRYFNDINRDIVNEDVRNQLLQQGITNTGLTITTTSLPWRVTSFMVGFGTISPLNDNKAAFLTRFALGYADISSPEISTVVRDQFNNGGQLILLKSSSDGLAFQLGFGFKFQISQEADILLSADYFNTHAEFNNVGEITNGVRTGNINFEQNISILAISLGIALNLN